MKYNHDDYEALYNRGLAYADKGDFDRAIEDYNEALRIKPDDYEALYNRGLAYADKGDFDRAIKDLEAALRINPNDVETANALELVKKEIRLNTTR